MEVDKSQPSIIVDGVPVLRMKPGTLAAVRSMLKIRRDLRNDPIDSVIKVEEPSGRNRVFRVIAHDGSYLVAVPVVRGRRK